MLLLVTSTLLTLSKAATPTAKIQRIATSCNSPQPQASEIVGSIACGETVTGYHASAETGNTIYTFNVGTKSNSATPCVVTANSCPSDFDTVVAFADDSGTIGNCNDDAYGACGYQSIVAQEIPSTSAETYWIKLNGYGGSMVSVGTYGLSLQCSDSCYEPGQCIASCQDENGDNITDDNYQSCNGCSVYASCVGGILYDNRPCAPVAPGADPLQWDDNLKVCTYDSHTCSP